MSEFEKENMTMPERTRRKKYQHFLDMKVRDPKTLKGETLIYNNTDQNYSRICSGVIPKYNKKYSPMHWVFVLSDDKSKILIQRTA